MMVGEASLEESDYGRTPRGAGWFVLNACDAVWRSRGARHGLTFTGSAAEEVEEHFQQLGVNLVVLHPGEPSCMYHWETEQEGLFVVSGEALLVIEGQERPLRQWDFVHCPPGTNHVVVGAGKGPCVVLAMSSRENQMNGPWGWYTTDDVAHRHNACVDEATQDAEVAYGALPASVPSKYHSGWLPG